MIRAESLRSCERPLTLFRKTFRVFSSMLHGEGISELTSGVIFQRCYVQEKLKGSELSKIE